LFQDQVEPFCVVTALDFQLLEERFQINHKARNETDQSNTPHSSPIQEIHHFAEEHIRKQNKGAIM